MCVELIEMDKVINQFEISGSSCFVCIGKGVGLQLEVRLGRRLTLLIELS